MSKLIKYFLLLLLFIFAFSIFFHSDTAITQDLGRHLTLGKIIWTEKKIPTTNLFSYTHPDFPFLNHHWGSEVIFYLVNKFGGINGLLILKLMMMLTAIIILKVFVLKRVSFPAFLISNILILEVLKERTEVRPEIFAYLTFVLFLVILYREKENKLINPGGLWLLPILQIAWANLHISFIFGPVIYFLFLIDRILCRKIKKKYFILGIFLLAATLINPFGWKGAIYHLKLFQNYGYSIVENQSPFFLEKLMTNPTIFYFKLSFILFMLITPFLFARKYFYEIITVFVFGILSVWAIRNFPFFAAILFYPLSLGITKVFEKLNIFSWFAKNSSKIRGIFYLFVSVFIFWEIFNLLSNRYYLQSFSQLRTGVGQVTGMKNTVNFFQTQKLPGPIFNNFDIGSYLIYRLYPHQRVFVDGRPEAYPVSFFQEIYIPMQEKKEIWNTISGKYKFQTIIFSHTDMTPWARQFL